MLRIADDALRDMLFITCMRASRTVDIRPRRPSFLRRSTAHDIHVRSTFFIARRYLGETMRALPASPLFCVASAPAAAARRALPLAAEPPGWPRALRASLATASERCVAARASETDSEAQPAAVDEAPKQPRVFASRARKDAPEPPRLDRPRLEPRGVDEQPRAASPATPAAERQFGRFARDASGNFARPGGAPPAPEDDRPPPRAFTSGAGGPREGGGGRFGGPAFGQRGAPGGAAAAPGRGGGVRTAERDKLGRKGRADDGPATFGRAATEARRNARATRKEERSNKTTKKERVEFLELPPQGLSVEELADKLALNSADIIKALFLKGIMTTVNMARTPLATNAAIAHPQPRPCADFGQREGAAAGQGVRG